MRYLVTLNGQTHTVELEGDRVTVDGIEHRATLVQREGTPERLLTLDGRSYPLPMWNGSRGTWAVMTGGERFDVEALDERSVHIRSLSGSASSQSGPVPLKAPMPGLVVKVLASSGDKVVQGQSLIVLEAMKMQNELKAAATAVVDAVTVAVGRAVERGEVLLTFKSASS